MQCFAKRVSAHAQWSMRGRLCLIHTCIRNIKKYFVVILWNNEVGGTCKMNIEMTLKSRSYILDLDCVLLFLGIFFFLCCLMESFFSPAFRIYLYFCQKHTQKSHKFNVWPNFTCGTDSLVVPWRAINGDTWHMTHDMWHLTQDMWHMTYAT